jgi:hypothetical protein
MQIVSATTSADTPPIFFELSQEQERALAMATLCFFEDGEDEGE